MTSAVFKFGRIVDDPRYDGFVSDGIFPHGLPKAPRTPGWQMNRLAPTWGPPHVTGRAGKYHDYPCVDLVDPVFSQRAVNALREFLEPNGELLPLPTPQGLYYAFNLTTVVNALDVDRTDALWLTDSRETALRVRRFEFVASAIEPLSIFTIPQKPMTKFVTQRFVEKVLSSGLNGMQFDILSPLPPSVDWEELATSGRERQRKLGLPKGQNVTGESVIVRMKLSRRIGERVAERKVIEGIVKQLESLLVGSSDLFNIFFGSLEGHDFGEDREGRLFLSCPDANRLAEFLRPWFLNLRWPHSSTLVKRFGGYADPTAAEEVVLRLSGQKHLQ